MRSLLWLALILWGAVALLPADAKGTDQLDVPGSYPAIQSAIDAALDGDVVLVGPGNYAENINFKGKAILVTSSEGPEKTIIEGSRRDSVVKFYSHEGRESVLEGFTITGGYPRFDAGQGGGVSIWLSSPTIRGNIISGNWACAGGGIFCNTVRHSSRATSSTAMSSTAALEATEEASLESDRTQL